MEEFEGFEEFLLSRGLTLIEIKQIREDKITPKIMLLMEDAELSTFIPKYGDRVAVKHFCTLKYNSENSKKDVLLERLKHKINKGKDLNKRDNNEPPSKKKTDKQIFLGWLCCLDDKQYRQVKEVGGGGTRKINVPRWANKAYLINKGKELFFPAGKSKNGNLKEFQFDLFDYQRTVIDDETTVESLLEATGLTKLRFYLATKKIPETENTETYDSETQSVDPGTPVEHLWDEVQFTPKNCCCYCTDNTVIPTCTSEISNGSNEVSNRNNNKDQSLQQLSTEYNVLVNSILDEVCENPNNMVFEDPTNITTDNAFCESYTDLRESTIAAPQTVQEILKVLQDQIDGTRINKFNVYRDDIFKCCIRAMRRKSFAPFYRISVKFSDIEGLSEGAVDEGGPKREMFRLVLSTIKDSNLFVGNKKKNISLDATALEDRHYFEAGRLIALSLVHGGPAPHFFSPMLFDLIIGNDISWVQFNIEDVWEEIRSPLISLQNATNLNEARDIIISNNIFSIAGYNFIYKEEDKSNILQGTLRFYIVSRIKEALDQFVEGLKTCNIYEYLKKYPHLFRSEMCDNPRAITADDFEQLFTITSSEPGSNNRQMDRIISFFRDYLADCELNSDVSPDSDQTLITLRDLLIFATGADEIPPLGLPVTPQILFLHNEYSRYPLANTCGLQLKLPVLHDNYDDFKNALDFGIANSNTFGFA